jgi:uncharacterized damage-inducible protein DinB
MTASLDVPAGVSAADLLFADFPHEHAATRRILERYPDGRGAWRPHPKSRTLAQLATHVADLPNRGVSVLSTDGLDLVGRVPMEPIDSASGLLAHFEAARERLDALLRAATLAELEQPWAMKRGEQILLAAPRRVLLRTLTMSHLTHHRAQLGVYYRLLDIAVPGMYGPSADD